MSSQRKTQEPKYTEAQIEEILDMLVRRSARCVDRDGKGNYSGSLIEGCLCRFIDKSSSLDASSIDINFKEKKIVWTTWMISGHNGDSFGEKTGTLSWDHVTHLGPAITRACEDQAKKEIAEEQKQQQQTIIDRRVASMLEELKHPNGKHK